MSVSLPILQNIDTDTVLKIVANLKFSKSVIAVTDSNEFE